ncbi:MAG: signal peptide peptidase SppA [Candidatus Diapherotrites archaeon]|uniref:Signal peptide peptidase SppA n=1 Tax=Candidatus Iainarchaeum sp. TaxID=3101447 RepID=A0A939C784_9ARCH|nr:signal peptide peptidase SppA [Candidatus Diapherotrites archaeon]
MNKLIIAVLFGVIVLIGLAALISSLVVLSPSIGLFSNKIAVIPLKGSIESEKTAFASELSASEIVERLEDAKDDPSVAAIFLDIDSPGGSIVATKQVVAAVRDAKQEKPVVSWIGDLGASGAYYVAAASDCIIADEDSLTGSIGVVSVVLSIEGFLEELGIDANVLTAGSHKAMGSLFEDLDEGDAAILQEILENAFSHFKRDIAEFRSGKLNLPLFDEVTDGRVLSGEQALSVGLIDGLGTRQHAIDKAAELAGIKSPVLADFGEKSVSLFDMFGDAGYSFGFGVRQGFLESADPKIQA